MDGTLATRSQLEELLDAGHTYETAARELGIPAGLAYMIVTGMPADGSDAYSPQELAAARSLPGSSQHLLGVPAMNPTRHEHVDSWVAERARRELRRPG
jgi:hypothetical protein